MAPKTRKRNASDAPSSSQRPNTLPEPTNSNQQGSLGTQEITRQTSQGIPCSQEGAAKTNPHLAPIPSQDIPAFCLSNMEKGKGKFEGALRPIPVGGSSSKGKGVEDVEHGKKKTWEARDEGDSNEE
ncbi:hypothetical protein PIB30_055409 [Stylosanthes scabra]|uniref:Uncharacterized protein n=1 Tax=Stylosanthes scabra TaxID=79078 RepID=A0ABU6XK95_9FABA|nr:hypothetical protein [Stylosanthes scabra]